MGKRQIPFKWSRKSFGPDYDRKTMRKKVGARVRVLEQDEYRTSKLSCCCHEIMSGLVIAGKRSYHVRVCPNVNCPRNPWDRNVSAAINILYLFKNYNVDMNETPEAFRHEPPPAPAIPPVAGQNIMMEE